MAKSGTIWLCHIFPHQILPMPPPSPPLVACPEGGCWGCNADPDMQREGDSKRGGQRYHKGQVSMRTSGFTHCFDFVEINGSHCLRQATGDHTYAPQGAAA